MTPSAGEGSPQVSDSPGHARYAMNLSQNALNPRFDAVAVLKPQIEKIAHWQGVLFPAQTRTVG